MRAVCIAVHDVAPETWPLCERLLALLDEFGCTRISLLVVPHFHHRRPLLDAPATVRAIEARLAAGAEAVLHGYYHLDECGRARSPGEWFRRHCLTDGEGEFEGLSPAEARLRIECGLTVFARLGWPVEGFVAPAWLAGRGTLPALRETPLRYMSTQGSLWMVHEAARYRAPCLTASTRASWRRGMSAAIIPAVRRALRNVPVVRVALHPNDAKYENITDLWRGVIGALLCEREPLTKADALRRLHAGQAPATSGSR